MKTQPIKLKFVACILLATLIFFSSCEKDPVESNKSIEGLWVGTIQNSTSGAQVYNLSIKPGGTASFESVAGGKEHFGIGTWSLTGTTFTANIETLYGISTNVGVKQRLTAEYDQNAGTLSSGTYINTSGGEDSGSFSLTKVQ